MTPQEEAAQIFKEVVTDLSRSNRDVKSALRKCLHACQIMGWVDQAAWFEQELGGYASVNDLPPHRQLKGRLVWDLKNMPGFALNPTNAAMPGFGEVLALPQESTIVKIWTAIDWMIEAAARGLLESTGEQRTLHVGPGKGIDLLLERKQIVDAATLAYALNRIEHFTFEFASKQYALLSYGEAITDIWQTYRQAVDSRLATLNFGGHLEAIRNGIRSSNPQDWRLASFGCRDLLEDVATYLWRDPRPTYDLLRGDAKNGKLKVTKDRYLNRLSAYLHQQMITKHSDKFLHDELERLDASIRSLASDQSSAHTSISLLDAQQVVLGTYFILGALVTKTDMQPITSYQEDSPGAPT
jgi:hypothetical protein